MITRLWFVLSLTWAALMFYNATTRAVFRFDGIDALLVFGPFAAGLLLKRAGRYIVKGN